MRTSASPIRFGESPISREIEAASDCRCARPVPSIVRRTLIADDVVYVLDASLPRGTTITAGEPYESRGEWRSWQGDEVLVSPDVLAALLVRPSPEPPAAGQLRVEHACRLLRVSRSTLDSRSRTSAMSWSASRREQ